MQRRLMRPRNAEQGMSLIELMISMGILAVGMAALLGLIISSITNNNKARTDTGSTLAAELIIETVSGKDPANGLTVTVRDCAGNNILVNTTPAVAPGAGATLDATGAIDWTNQTNAAVPAGYKMLYQACTSNGRQITYDVRWNIRTIDQYSKLVTVSSRPTGATVNNARRDVLFERPVSLRTIAVSGN